MDCPFCDSKITKDQGFYESQFCHVIYNYTPANKGQCLVVPKRHVENIRELTSEEASDLFLTVQLVSRKLNDYLKPVGFNYGINEGYYSGQRVEHLHFHVLPRMEGDKGCLPEYHLFHRDPKTKKVLTDEEIGSLVEELRGIF